MVEGEDKNLSVQYYVDTKGRKLIKYESYIQYNVGENGQTAMIRMNCVEDPTELESPTKYLKYTVWGNNGDDVFVGVLLTNNVVLAPLLRLDKANIVYKEMYSLEFIDRTNSLPYAKARYVKNFTLLRLMKNLNVTHGSKTITMLPKNEFQKDRDCVAVSRAIFKPEIVETKVLVAVNEKCKENICIELDSCNTNHCDHFSSGAILVCDGVLTGIISPTIIGECDRSQSLPVADIFKESQLIENQLNELSTINLISRYAKYLVYFGWEVGGEFAIQGMGVILTKNLILTYYAPDMSNRQKPFKNINDEVLEYGFIVYGVKHFSWEPSTNITWNKARNYAKVPDNRPDMTRIQLAIIKLDRNLRVDERRVGKMRLHNHNVVENLQAGATCIVPVYERTNGCPIRDKEYEIVDKKSCSVLLHLNHRNKSYVCIKEDCDALTAGAPLICGGLLTGITLYSQQPTKDEKCKVTLGRKKMLVNLALLLLIVKEISFECILLGVSQLSTLPFKA
uniref:Peptidase S1 domain-containing protein n=1 Tax=Glossina pallidipes TaxID=7398 RepID=A0A1A9Z6G6_GLOPL